MRECLVNGTTRMRTQVEIDPGIGLRGFEAIRALADAYRWAIDIELCVFPQEGLTNYPGTEELLVDGAEGTARRCSAARRATTATRRRRSTASSRSPANTMSTSTCISMSATAPSTWTSASVLELTEQYKRGGRVVVGHMAKLSLMPPAERRRRWRGGSPMPGSRSRCCRRPISI